MALFCVFYALINQHLLTHYVLYRAAANDFDNAIWSLAILSFQALVLLIAAIGLRRRYFIALCILATVSALVNMVYGQILNDTLDPGKFKWLLEESRQAGNAAGEFLSPFLFALAKMLVAILALCASRSVFRRYFSVRRWSMDANHWLSPAILVLSLILPSVALGSLNWGPEASERNSYSLLYQIATAEELPTKEKVQIEQSGPAAVQKIVWLVDESISYQAYTKLIRPDVIKQSAIDFGPALSLSSCSGPSNFAMRSGIDVDSVSDTTDLRKMPTIWAYAKKAGYQTLLVDGQVSGPPQNIMLDTERSLIDRYEASLGGLKTDQFIADKLNQQLKSGDRQFFYIVLKGVHFQYRDHYPAGLLVEDASVQEQYEAAVQYSKDGFFDTLLKDVDRSEVAIFYTSDHGQNIKNGVTPHCTPDPPLAEFEVPMVAFLPPSQMNQYRNLSPGRRSTSQLFPTTLGLMGYNLTAAIENYDADLARPSKNPLWFGRSVIPLNAGDKIELHEHQVPES